MPEHLLDYAQVAAVVEKMGGKTVSECVRRKVFHYTGFSTVFPNEAPDGFGAYDCASSG